MVSLVTLITFWKKKDGQTSPEQERVIPLPNMPPSTLKGLRSTSVEAVKQARETLKVLKLERQILGSAVTTIYDSQMKGVITESERDRLLEKYKVDLKDLEKAIEENQQVVDLYDLQVEREQVTKDYKTKLAEIDGRLEELKSGASLKPQDLVQARERTGQAVEVNNPHGDGGSESGQERPVKQKDEGEISDAEKRIGKIREEILQAMDRLEQIEAEG